MRALLNHGNNKGTVSQSEAESSRSLFFLFLKKIRKQLPSEPEFAPIRYLSNYAFCKKATSTLDSAK